MAIAIVDTGATQTGTSTTSITLSATLSASADLLIVCVTHRSTSVANNYPTGQARMRKKTASGFIMLAIQYGL